MPIKSLLIANRGEIAIRIIRACRELGIRSIAVYSEADRSAMHVRLADSALSIGAAPAVESYLNTDCILAAAKRSGADAVHPGYGFLSERAEFSEACLNAGLIFVGPPPSVIRALGDKIAARSAMQAAGVPVTPGYNGEHQANAALRRAAEEIGFPVMIKAAAGGGGRGMRLAPGAAEFEDLLVEARKEALAAFGDDRVLLEKFIEHARHVEFQIIGDVYGTVLHLHERDCSIQRRHQKIVEESPSPALDGAVKARMAEAAVLAGRTAGYVNAGTVEFLLDQTEHGAGQFYFMEVNARLQVEHPVTEVVTGLDLVHVQFRVASGEPLGMEQSDITSRGHTIEVRIYAEDPASAFRPSIGTVRRWIEPEGPGIRVDSGFTDGDTVSPYYDSMLAKLIVYGESREAAVQRLSSALKQFCVLGIETNIPYLQAIVDHEEFRAGRVTTQFISRYFADWRPEPEVPASVLLALAANTLAPARRPRAGEGLRSASELWQCGAWRNA